MTTTNMTTSRRSRSRNASDESTLCQFSFADGRTCRMLRQPGHPTLCVFHARAERQILESDRLGSELAATFTGKFMTATDINFALGKLYQAIAQNRIPPRNAANLAFVAKLLLLSLDKLNNEFRFEYEFEQWIRMQDASRPLSNPPSPSFINAQPPNSVSLAANQPGSNNSQGEATAGGPS
jgi:hypothetical protein